MKDEAVDRYRKRREKRRQARYDFEVGDFAPDETGDRGPSHGNTRLPYGLCKSAGIDTTGMSPSEAWAALMGKTGVSAKEAYKKLEKYGTAKGIDVKKYAEEGDLSGTEELAGHGDIPEAFKPGSTAKKKAKSKTAQEAIDAINSKAKSEAQIQKQLDKLKKEYGEDGVIGFITEGGRAYTMGLNEPLTASNIEYFKKSTNLFSYAASNEDEARKERHAMVDAWKNSGDVNEIAMAYAYELVKLKKNKHTGKISEEEYKAETEKISGEKNARVLKALPSYDSCKSNREVVLRMDAQGNFREGQDIANSTDFENLKEAATSAERMFGIFPAMKKHVSGIVTTRLKKNAYAWVEYKTNSGIFMSKGYAADRKKMCDQYEVDTLAGFHPKGTDTRSVVYHEFTHIIDMNLSEYAKSHGGFPGYTTFPPMLSTVIIREMAKERGVHSADLKKEVSGYASRTYKLPRMDDMEFLAECMAEYIGSPHPRDVATDCAKRLFSYMRKYWGEDAVNEKEIKK